MVLVLVTLAGCRAGPPGLSADPLGAVPADFSVDLTILAGPQVEQPSEAHARQGRFVLLCDGSLHWASDQTRRSDWLPPRRRILSRRQLAELWSLAQHLGLADSANADTPLNVNLVEPEPRQTVYVAIFTGGGDRWCHVRRRDDDEQPDAAMVRFVRRLAELAWAGDLPEDRARVIPRRYDFGPDPYARYRRP